jgi:hypothetical protein
LFISTCSSPLVHPHLFILSTSLVRASLPPPFPGIMDLSID